METEVAANRVCNVGGTSSPCFGSISRLFERRDVQRPFSTRANPDYIDLEGRHPSAEEQEQTAVRFRRNEEDLATDERADLLNPSIWRRFVRFWGGVLRATLRGQSS